MLQGKSSSISKAHIKECIDICRTHASISTQNKTMTHQEVSAVSTRPSRSKHLSANKQKKSAHADKGKKNPLYFLWQKACQR